MSPDPKSRASSRGRGGPKAGFAGRRGCRHVVSAAAGAAAAAPTATARPAEARRLRRAVHGERGELLDHLRRPAVGAGDDLLVVSDELVEVPFALHAGVLVDRHGSSLVTPPATAWTAPTLEGRLVRLEPLTVAHADGLWAASRDPRTWRWLPITQPQTRTAFDAFLGEALAAAAAGTELPLATVCCKQPPGSTLPSRPGGGTVVGSTRYLVLTPEHRSVEIGWTWLHPDAWSTGVNVEAKLLMLEHAFESWGCRRVELKTDALNERSRKAMEALGATFEGIHRQHRLVRDGENRDSAWYSVLDSEWPRVREGLRARLSVLGG